MSDETREQSETTKQAIAKQLGSINTNIEGLLLEVKSAQKRNFVTSDFVIDELRRLSTSLDRLTEELARHP